MLNYLLKRLGYGILVLFGVVVIVFFLFNVLPVDPARLTLGQRADVSSIEAIRKEHGFDKPLPVQFLMYLGDLMPVWVHGSSPEEKEKYGYAALFQVGGEKALVVKWPYLRRSIQTGRPVSEILAEKIPPTMILAITAILLASFVGIFLGIIAAINHNKFIDNAAVTLSIIGISQPSYFSGIILALLFGFLWHDYTGLNHVGSLFELNDYGEDIIVWKNLILPAIALGIRPIAIITQLTRSSMLEVLSQDYIRTAKAKGLAFSKILYKHSLKNALNPVITSVSGWFAALLAGAYFVEIIFDFKGLGYETVRALMNFDFPVAMGSVLFTAAAFVLINILVDIIYAILDPRIRVG
ncbi:MAG: ABC transporter permease [Chitinophagaceae bacterium]|nr:MAG: ABC transporter permease [Chitinophagaceae bacterium]